MSTNLQSGHHPVWIGYCYVLPISLGTERKKNGICSAVFHLGFFRILQFAMTAMLDFQMSTILFFINDPI